MIRRKKNNDIGYIPGFAKPSRIILNKKLFHSQVYLATHKGELRLPFMDRSFISFSFGGKIILDFGIIKVTGGERMEKLLYAEFEDIAEEYNVLDGQFYWGTHIKPLELSFVLSTDHMTQTQLDNFKYWFSPGQTRELILALHPNRAIMARVNAAPSMSMLPFRGTESKKIAGASYLIPTTIYKGDIRISFISEDPYWYALCVLLGNRYKIDNDGEVILLDATGIRVSEDYYYEYRWYNVNGDLVGLMSDDDALKIILLDNIAAPHMIKIFDNLFLGNNILVTDKLSLVNGENRSISAMVADLTDDPNPPYAKVGIARLGISYAPALHTYNFESYLGVDLFSDINCAYLYYPGTAPSYPKIRFSLTPILSDAVNLPPYIIAPKNSYSKLNDFDATYNTIYFTAKTTKEFRFSTPSAWTGYNQALYWFKKMAQQSASLEDTKIYIRDYVNHNGARAWGLNIIEYFLSLGKEVLVLSVDENSAENKISIDIIYNYMKIFICNYLNSSWKPCISNFSIDSKTGEAIGEITYRLINKNNLSSEVIDNIPEFFSGSSLLTSHVENVGNMIKSNYIILEETNTPNLKGEIVMWSLENPNTTYKITTDYPSIGEDGLIFIPGLINFNILYQYMYR